MSRIKPLRAWAAAAAIGVWVCAASGIASAQQPSNNTSKGCDYIDYAHPGTRRYQIREVRFESKIDFLHAISSYLKEVKVKLNLPLQEGKDYPLVDIVTEKDVGRDMIQDELRKAGMTPEFARFSTARARLEKCDENAAQLDVVYYIFLTNYDDYLSHTWELKSKEAEEPGNAAAEPKAEQAKGFLTVKPIAGYNDTRRGFGGGLVRLKLPRGPFETAEVSVVGSPTSDEEAFELAGSRSPGLAVLNRLDYRLFYKHSNEPAGANRLRDAMLSFQAFGASRPLGSRGIILRYGASIEGGNQHTHRDLAAAAGASAADSGYGGLKAYVGTTMRLASIALAVSYGIQLGARGVAADLDFVKHLGDLALTTQFWKTEGKPGKVNKALTIDVRLAGGTINSHRQIPVAQRFFGGNVQRNFIGGDNWRMLSEPFIRSLPENRLNSTGEIGGTRFYSANFTVGREVWGYPLMPKELKKEEGFVDTILPGTIASTRGFLHDNYLLKVPEYVAAINNIPTMKMPTGETLHLWLNALSAKLGDLVNHLPANLEQEQRDDIEEIATDAKDTITEITFQFEEPQKANLPQSFKAYLIDEKSNCHPTESQSCTRATTVRFRLEDLAAVLEENGAHIDEAENAARMKAAAATARADAATILQAQKDIAFHIGSIDVSLADNMAKTDTDLVKAALDAFVKELNVVAVSPVVVFDVARVWPDAAGTRYGAGGGLRLSVFNFNTTVGYAFNLKHRAGDGRGALFFSMDLTDIFR